MRLSQKNEKLEPLSLFQRASSWGIGEDQGFLGPIFSLLTLKLTNNFTNVLRSPVFSDIIEGFALQKAWLSAQTEAWRVVRNVNDGSKTDFSGLAARLASKKYKLGTKK